MPFRKKVSPFSADPKLIFHGTYHKMGTVWLMRVLERVAENWSLKIQKSNEHGDTLNRDTDIIFANHSHLRLNQLGEFVGSHMIRATALSRDTSTTFGRTRRGREPLKNSSMVCPIRIISRA
jgi:hypothetical protein